MSENKWWQTEKNDSVATKRRLWEPIAERIGGFDLDPAAGCEPTPIAAERYTPADDGLIQPWYGTVWLNPPFSEKSEWYRRLVDQYWNGDVKRAVSLAKVDTSTDWFQNWFSTADVICFLDGRDWYIAAGTSPTFGTMVGVWNPTPDVVDWLETIGTVVEPEKTDQQTALCGVLND